MAYYPTPARPPAQQYQSHPNALRMSDKRYLEVAYVVGGRIRMLRLDRGLLLRDLADKIIRPETGEGYSVSYLSRLERGWANAPLYVYLRIAEALGVDEWSLFARDEVAKEVSAAEMVLVRFLRETNTPAERALARLVGGSLSR